MKEFGHTKFITGKIVKIYIYTEKILKKVVEVEKLFYLCTESAVW